jgi:hypothetical protein
METLARREGQTRDALLAAAGGDLWGATVENGLASLGLPGQPEGAAGPEGTGAVEGAAGLEGAAGFEGAAGLEGAAGVGEITIDLDHPDLARVPEQDLRLALATCASAGVVARGVGG